ncbi:MAG: hypothetical protein FWD55_01740 [Propionibacteriaceae bacterium]|nr:hypothetical protein [Propionibacteriaceae bacterium]
MTILLLFTLGAVSYHITILLTGLTAPLWTWAVIPLIALGCIIQLIITLAAYRTSIEQAEVSLGTPKLEKLNLMALVASLLIPFILAYSAFGFFDSFARNGVLATEFIHGMTSGVLFLQLLNTRGSTTITVIVAAIVIALWVSARFMKAWARRKNSALLSLFSTFLIVTGTILMLFSAFRLIWDFQQWINDRVFMSWWDSAVGWVGDLIHIDLPQILVVVQAFLADTLWPVFWDVLSQPLLWLGVVALVGGMQFMDVSTIWARMSSKLNIRRENQVLSGLIGWIVGVLDDVLESALKFLHLLAVALKAGVPFLATLIISFTVIEQAGAWFDFCVQKLLGPIEAKAVLITTPLFSIGEMILVPGLQAIFLATAYIRLRHKDQALSFERPTGVNWKSLVSILLAITIAAGISLVEPPDADPRVHLELGIPAQVMGRGVTIDDLRAGTSMTGKVSYTTLDKPITTLGVFIAVSVTVNCYSSGTVRVEAEVDDLVYPTWSSAGTLSCHAGYTASADIVFEIPREEPDHITIIVTPVQLFMSTLEIGDYRLPSTLVVHSEIFVDDTLVEEIR